MIHPLLNSDSKHYDGKEKPAIFELEKKMSVQAMMGACEFNIFKYENRLGKKIQQQYISERRKLQHLEEVKQKDLKKIATYKDYADVLKKLLWQGYKYHTVSFAFEQEGIEFDY